MLGYGISLVAFVLALRHLGAARTGAYFSTAPFVGAALALLLLREAPPALPPDYAVAMLSSSPQPLPVGLNWEFEVSLTVCACAAKAHARPAASRLSCRLNCIFSPFKSL